MLIIWLPIGCCERPMPKQVFRKVHEKPIMELNNGDGNKIVQKAVSFYAKQQRKSTSHLC